MRGIDNIFQVIVPLTFLAIWALTSLFNREAQPLPPRTGRAPGPNGPRPMPGPSSARAAEWRPETFPREPVPGRPAPPGPVRAPVPRAGGRPDDEILVIESET